MNTQHYVVMLSILLLLARGGVHVKPIPVYLVTFSQPPSQPSVMSLGMRLVTE